VLFPHQTQTLSHANFERKRDFSIVLVPKTIVNYSFSDIPCLLLNSSENNKTKKTMGLESRVSLFFCKLVKTIFRYDRYLAS